MSDAATIAARLAEHFPPSEIEWRVGSTNAAKDKGLALAYLTARHIMDRLDDVVGPAHWQDRYEVHGDKTLCYLSVRIDGEWITKADGAGDSDVEAEKGAISDALKRAAVKWGIGRYLYDVKSPWVAIESAGRSFKIAASETPKLIAALGGAKASNVKAAPAPAKPAAKPEAVKAEPAKSTAIPADNPFDLPAVEPTSYSVADDLLTQADAAFMAGTKQLVDWWNGITKDEKEMVWPRMGSDLRDPINESRGKRAA